MEPYTASMPAHHDCQGHLLAGAQHTFYQAHRLNTATPTADVHKCTGELCSWPKGIISGFFHASRQEDETKGWEAHHPVRLETQFTDRVASCSTAKELEGSLEGHQCPGSWGRTARVVPRRKGYFSPSQRLSLGVAERRCANVPPPRTWRAVTDGVTDGATLASLQIRGAT